MNRCAKRFLPALFLLMTSGVWAQSQKDMRLNEILVFNTDDYEDDYGNRHGWIELFNSSYGTVDLGGCYLTNDPSNLKKYIIPRGDVLTKIRPRQHVLFWADNQPFRGTFHVNFTLEESSEVLLVSSDGKTIIDRCQVPKLQENVSYGRVIDGVGSWGPQSTDEGWDLLPRTSPSTNNSLVDVGRKSRMIEEFDPHGAVMAVTAMSVVFIALILLFTIFSLIGKGSIRASQRRAQEKGHTSVTEADIEDTAGEVYAAIAMALHLCQTDEDTHDIENTILTINRVTRNYSPWSSKIYSLRETPGKKH